LPMTHMPFKVLTMASTGTPSRSPWASSIMGSVIPAVAARPAPRQLRGPSRG
jgi:hypothetical protein